MVPSGLLPANQLQSHSSKLLCVETAGNSNVVEIPKSKTQHYKVVLMIQILNTEDIQIEKEILLIYK